ncbi:CvpA family protein [Lacrimispora saccharolytica]|uniref:Colicin V production protein n=1 Tax=Lacrimispora saccharolytica (strain ATCC 35040 / DSM 2544 / NRCC 2533 / WM1) TaxID=610130 RepID=D9R1T1_LACSW|nr:CvpA family protein [Lacrimispora saccharolytica]ADL02822.1 Colicin V production protein [[Clostridium] saccharolyticum WM1]
MTKLYMENWLSVLAGVYLLGMVLYGHHRGFIRLVVSMLAVVLSLTVVRAALPSVTGFLKENTGLQQTISENMKKSIGLEPEEKPDGEALEAPSVQRTVIENLKLPQNMKNALIENNNSEVYQMLGVQAFTDYIGSYLADVILNSAGFVLLFAAIYLFSRLVMRWLDIIARLPILSGINKIAGAVLGGVEGLVFLWIAGLLVTAFSGTQWGLILTRQIEASKWLSYLYSHNFLNLMVLGVLRGFL